MNEESAKFKKEKQLPAPDLEQAGRVKFSSKKPWTIEHEWKDGSIFTRKIRAKIDGKWVEKLESQTLEEVKAEECTRWTWRLWGGCFSSYKTKKSALQAWENFKSKPEYGQHKRKSLDEKSIYKLINKKTGEEEILWS